MFCTQPCDQCSSLLFSWSTVQNGAVRCCALNHAINAVCPVPLSLFVDPERILRRLYVFAEKPCKSTNATSEPCSPVFKEAQPRSSEHSNLEYHINNLNLYLYVFGLFSIFVIKSIQPDCDKIKGISVLLLETPLTRSKYFSPYTHAQRLTRTSGTFCTFAYKQTLHWWRI